MPLSTYPLAFRAILHESSVPFDHALRVAQAIEHTILDVFGEHMNVLSFSSFEDEPKRKDQSGPESEVWVSVLVEFPADDAGIVEDVFKGVSDEMRKEGWEVLLPGKNECRAAFWLGWHLDPMTL
ncbi:hypothetical protein BDW74DRAFT_176645 [Aspergillus multicolor]|uniref:uncharacterized protein n=1 Tax=Aspergillus multicolor TaxID=41759 RepID=UPI003CCCF67C